MVPPTRTEVLVAGSGPAGATAALALARAGVDVLLVERARFPRFHKGESLLPRNLALFRELGLEERLQGITRQRSLIHRYYHPAFRELMMEREGPVSVHRALFSVLAGEVFPRPRFSMRWRLGLMELLIAVQAHLYPPGPPT